MAIHNLLIPQGDDFELRLTLCYGTSLRCPAMASAVPVQIKINPIGANMLLGQKLLYGGCGELVLSLPVGPLDTTATVASIPDDLPANQSFQATPIDITGWQGFSSIRPSYGQSSSWDMTCTVDGDPLKGTFLLFLPRIISKTIPSNCTASELAELEGFDSSDSATWGKFGRGANVWDFDTVDLRDRRTRRTEGRVLVSGEVTL